MQIRQRLETKLYNIFPCLSLSVVGGQLIETGTDNIPLMIIRALLRIHNHRSEQKSNTQFWYITTVLKFSETFK
jgi:hypothetical protein